MKIINTTTPATTPKTKESASIAYLYAFIMLVFALSQLFAFDEFLELFISFSLPGGSVIAYLLASIVVVAETFALPFLLRLRLSPLMRITSMVCGWIVPIIWLFVSFWIVLTGNPVENIGFLGTKLTLMPGWWSIFISIALGALAAWASWGMWPAGAQKKK